MSQVADDVKDGHILLVLHVGDAHKALGRAQGREHGEVEGLKLHVQLHAQASREAGRGGRRWWW
eukprot:CAMPEP_0202887772 /NCGR_PEP_ID=MMETSP1391-20130828/42855_1 /ASSEMBLY_ACC=CAM_ASM_000867 /TAXON_ID=1034604 /ORGANISM="Chlamydomonas leiostraca, Strain SAG 11-49" /LENGTH=63 /DNA_ID=CAMNT_0049571069 /DNA_START=1999 /DNA_END=2187 /DNA_ORIENTATION=-